MSARRLFCSLILVLLMATDNATGNCGNRGIYSFWHYSHESDLLRIDFTSPPTFTLTAMARIRKLSSPPPYQVGAYYQGNGTMVVYGANPTNGYVVFNTKTSTVVIPSSANDSGWGEPFSMWFDPQGKLWAVYITSSKITFVFLTVSSSRTIVTPVFTVPMPSGAWGRRWLTGAFDSDNLIYIVTGEIVSKAVIKVDLKNLNASLVLNFPQVWMPIYSTTLKTFFAMTNSSLPLTLVSFTSSLSTPTVIATYPTNPGFVGVPHHLVIDQALHLAYAKIMEMTYLTCSLTIGSVCTLHSSPTITAAQIYFCPG